MFNDNKCEQILNLNDFFPQFIGAKEKMRHNEKVKRRKPKREIKM